MNTSANSLVPKNNLKIIQWCREKAIRALFGIACTALRIYRVKSEQASCNKCFLLTCVATRRFEGFGCTQGAWFFFASTWLFRVSLQSVF